MSIGAILGAASQIALNSVQDKGKAEASTNNNVSFLSTVKEVAENLAGKIVVANGANIEGQNFLKEKFDYDIGETEQGDTVYDFLADIKKILKQKKER